MSVTNQAERVIKTIDKLPPFPEVARQVLVLSEDPKTGAEDIFNVIQYDQGVTANCLKLCNSSYFGLPEKVLSLRQAVVLLGTQNLVKIVLLGSGGLSAYGKSLEGYGFHKGELWRHSVSCAVISQLLAGKLGRSPNSVLFTASLLHDIGKLVLHEFVAEYFEMIIPLMRGGGLSLVETEKMVLGIDHAEVGSIIAEMWQFPPPLVNAIRNHHQSMSAEGEDDLDLLTRLSNLIVHVICSRHDGINSQINSGILRKIGMDQGDIQEIMVAFPDEINKAAELLEIPMGIRQQ